MDKTINALLPNTTLCNVTEAVGAATAKKVVKTMHGRDFDWSPKGNSGIVATLTKGNTITLVEQSAFTERKRREILANFNGEDSLYSQYFAAEHGVGFKVDDLYGSDGDQSVTTVLSLAEQSVDEDFKLVITTADTETTYLVEDINTCVEMINAGGVAGWSLNAVKEDVMNFSEDSLTKEYNVKFNAYKSGKMSIEQWIAYSTGILEKVLKTKVFKSGDGFASKARR
tara:strand:+ start:2397 stop:3077 length:681 start_codon:yes stop_codon:yes gene_type:complete